ncbi:MAG: phosphatase PAP2 family protein, partial [Ignavibacteria bacterium]|nr:phosphatase PAP2 family protein [Ignavibacteria bacterium]
MKDILKSDLRHLGSALVKVYPLTFRWLVRHWQWSLLGIFIIFSSFYLDNAVHSVVRNLIGEPIDTIFAFGRWYGSGEATLICFIILYFSGLIGSVYKLRETGLLIGEAYIFSGLITLLFKSATGRWRPYMNRDFLDFSGGWSWSNNDQFSYFSGHAAVSFALSTILASMTENIYLKIFYYLLAVITCFSRIYHNQHWFSDVVSGAI